MLEDYAGLEEGYCILGIDVKAFSGMVSETDTGGQSVGQQIEGDAKSELFFQSLFR